MFTGIVEEIGSIKSIRNGEKSSTLIVNAHKVLENTKLGDSICTSGVCLTVTKLSGSYFEADVMAESMRRTNLSELKAGDEVNLERALSLGDRLGGHMVSGHVDAACKIQSFEREDNAVWVTVKAPVAVLKYIVEKGSVALDGISLTVAYVDNEVFKVSIIPHTKSQTTLLHKKVGDRINVECDVLGKYVERILGFKNVEIEKKESNISESFLYENGFM